MAATSRTTNAEAARDRIFADVAAALDPPPFVPAIEWCPANLRIPNETESPGPFNLDLMPHVAEVLRLANESSVRRIFLRWAHRTSKTFTHLSLHIYWLRTSYLPQVLAGSDKPNTRDTRDELYRYLEASGFGDLLLPPHARSERFIQVGSRRLKIRNAGSRTDLSGYAACFGSAVEYSKSGWVARKSTEASSPNRFSKRFTGFPYDSKQILEGTPSLKDECNISAAMLKPSTQRRYRLVPCPHCGTFQQLQFSPEFGRHKSAGIKWDQRNGRDVASLAAATAWYQCVGGCQIDDSDRGLMLCRGVWVPEGMTIDKAGTLSGKPNVESDDIGLDELSTLYSRLISGWGQIAAEWVKVNDKSDPEGVRSFVNEWLARVYDPDPPRTTHNEIANRLRSTVPLGTVPEWARFLVWTSDVGKKQFWNEDQNGLVDVPLYWLMVTAFGVKVRSAVVAFKLAVGDDALRTARAGFQFPLECGPTLRVGNRDAERRATLCRPVLGAIDCGYRIKSRATRESDPAGSMTYHLYGLCDELTALDDTMPCLALHGITVDSPDLYKWDYRVAGERPSDVSRKRKWQEGDLLGVNTHGTQTWIDAAVRGVMSPDDPGRLTLPAEVCDTIKHPQHIEFLTQLGAEFFDGGGWASSGRHEWRDDWRYARALAQVVMDRHGATWDNPPNLLFPSTAGNTAADDDDGRDWIQTRQNWGR